jgi:hypothetical protein
MASRDAPPAAPSAPDAEPGRIEVVPAMRVAPEEDSREMDLLPLSEAAVRRLTGPGIGVILTALLALVSFFGSVYSAEIRMGLPDTWAMPAWVITGAFFLFFLLTVALFWFFKQAEAIERTQSRLLRQKNQQAYEARTRELQNVETEILTKANALAQAQQRALDEVKELSEKYERLITMPPRTFWGHFNTSYRLAEQAVASVFAAERRAVQEGHLLLPADLSAALRLVLAGYAKSAQAFDADHDSSALPEPYYANLMLVHERPAHDADPLWVHLQSRLRFHDGLPENQFRAILDLRQDLSVQAVLGTETIQADEALQNLALPFPVETLNREEPDEQGKPRPRYLPGAPQACAEVKSAVYFDLEKVEEWCRGASLSQDAAGQNVGYLRDFPHLGCFVSTPLFEVESHKDPARAAHLGPPTLPMAVLNLHRERPGFLRNHPLSADQFLMATLPFHLLIIRLLRLLLVTEAASSPVRHA